MKTAQHLAALTASAALAATGLTALGATPAAADTVISCSRAKTISTGWGQVTYTPCTKSTSAATHYKRVYGTVRDTKTDGCNVTATFKVFLDDVEKHKKTYTTGSSKSFDSGFLSGNSSSLTLSKSC
ncbi:hypothetical protein [Streptomyces bicolor]|uniref:hypothetical protein n=1 Tax=Streptomyces bicolor TaxID=66874 RepID=UPI0004E127C2|nr:hypothetical protein [Streptomyces bicolor]